jgi:Fe-S cluster assembly iron-binding protein IscA
MNKIMNKIQVASMHLAYIQEGKLDFIDEEINDVFATQFPEVNGFL